MSSEKRAEKYVHQMLRLVCDYPGQFGRLRATRVIGGYSFPERDGSPPKSALQSYVFANNEHSLGELVELTDAMLSGGLIDQTPGIRPTLVLRRAGFRALEALESMEVA